MHSWEMARSLWDLSCVVAQRLLLLPQHFDSMMDLNNCTIRKKTPKDRIDGWIGQPNTRGTLDILQTCVLTIFVCTYTILCLNVPAPNESAWILTGRKLFWMGLSIADPEFVLSYASGQWGTAQDSVKAFQDLGYPQWTLRHGCFVDMGGFLLVPKDSKPFITIGKHLHWLVSQKFLPIPEIPQKTDLNRTQLRKPLPFFRSVIWF